MPDKTFSGNGSPTRWKDTISGRQKASCEYLLDASTLYDPALPQLQVARHWKARGSDSQLDTIYTRIWEDTVMVCAMHVMLGLMGES